ncbi:hypothetical protein FOZ63_033999 [Perkinsus olseni]|uniref:Uncharacterized protein n=1 Tax=Perkinsus olseni TaxID=32597 RepID=A0A7J6QLQ0_PEROL|nr:hypothetical protein FOZ63_033999 [Perkinsus olseni]
MLGRMLSALGRTVGVKWPIGGVWPSFPVAPGRYRDILAHERTGFYLHGGCRSPSPYRRKGVSVAAQSVGTDAGIAVAGAAVGDADAAVGDAGAAAGDAGAAVGDAGAAAGDAGRAVYEAV